MDPPPAEGQTAYDLIINFKHKGVLVDMDFKLRRHPEDRDSEIFWRERLQVHHSQLYAVERRGLQLRNADFSRCGVLVRAGSHRCWSQIIKPQIIETITNEAKHPDQVAGKIDISVQDPLQPELYEVCNTKDIDLNKDHDP
jgi:hypothetical protein